MESEKDMQIVDNAIEERNPSVISDLTSFTEDCSATVDNELSNDDNLQMEIQIETTEENTSINEPKLLQHNFSKFSCVSQCRELFKVDHCLRGCKWSPDGTCLLTNCEDKTLRLFDLPQELYNKSTWDKGTLPDVSPSLSVTESGLVYDFDWYPLMTSWDQATSCFICTSTDCPIHLYDAFTGQLRGSYRGYDQYDEVAHAFCVAFDTSGSLIFSGYKDNVKIFDVSKPGRDYVNINTKMVGKQKGIISCINNNPDMPKVFAAGSYRRSLGVYTVDGSSLCQLIGHKGGLTQVKFSANGVRLYSAGRKDSEILCWDLRHPGKTLFTLNRPHSTNQRVYFDLTADNKYLVSGSTDGKLRVWDVCETFADNNDPKFEYASHKDCVNGTSLHRQLPMLATCSGQRHIPDLISDDEGDSKLFTRDHFKDVDNSVKMWWIGASENE